MGMAARWVYQAVIDGFSGNWLEPLLDCLDATWVVLRMRLGLVSMLGAAAALGGLAQAQCPDYTTFSQVGCLGWFGSLI